MPFTMSYSIDPPDAPKAKSPAAKPAKPRPSRVRKVTTPLAQAQALFEPAPARTNETQASADTTPEPDTTV